MPKDKRKSDQELIEEALKYGRNLKTFYRARDGSIRYELENVRKGPETVIVNKNQRIGLSLGTAIVISVIVGIIIKYI